MKYFGLNIVKHVQDFYAESYKTLLKKIKDLNTVFIVWKTQHNKCVNCPSNFYTGLTQFLSKFQQDLLEL